MKSTLSDWIREALAAQRIALIAHVSPDGDTVGASLALRRVFLALGKTVDVVCESPAPASLGFLPGVEAFLLPEQAKGPYDAAIAVDVSDRRMLGKAESVFDEAKIRLVIDHHATNPAYGDVNYIRGDECACCVLAYDAIEAMGVEMTREIGTCLMTGVSTDTGHFMYPYTTAKAFEMAGRLLNSGVDVSDITRRLYRSAPMSRVTLTRRVYEKMRFALCDRVGVIALTRRDFEETGTTPQQTDGMVNMALEIEGVRMAILATERDSGVKLSLRAVEPDTVSDIAKHFGGGGHAQAAGCTIQAPMDEAIAMVLAEMKKKL